MSENRCIKCASERIKVTPSGRRYCIPCRLAHEKRRKAALPADLPVADAGTSNEEERRDGR